MSQNYENSLRPSLGINETVYGVYTKFNRFNAFSSIYSFENISNPFTKIKYDGFMINTLPFNLNSLDLLPIILSNSDITFDRHKAIVSIIKKYSDDSLQINVSGFLGSVTGDPLIYKYTSPNLEVVNKNKIVPSYRLSVSNTLKKVKYRLAAGYVGYFSTNGRNQDAISNLSTYYANKQNKQVMLDAQLSYNLSDGSTVDLTHGFMSYYGFELIPFSMNINHLETYNNFTRLRWVNIIKDLSVSIKRDGSISFLNMTSSNENGKLEVEEYSAKIKYDLKFDADFDLSFTSTINNISFFNKSHELSNGQSLINTSKGRTYYNLNGKLDYKISKDYLATTEISFNDHFHLRNTLDYNFQLKGEVYEDFIFSINHSSIVRYPTIYELFGSYKSKDANDTFNVLGNSFLDVSRLKQFSITLVYKTKNIRSNTELHIVEIENPIVHSIQNQKYLNTKYYHRDSGFINGESRKGIEFFQESKISLLNSFFVETKFKYASFNNLKYVQKYRVNLKFGLNLASNTEFLASYKYIDKTVWEEFNSLSIVNDETNTLEKISIWSVYLNQKIENLLFVEELKFSLGIENLFNSNELYHPLGNDFGRTIIFTFNTSL